MIKTLSNIFKQDKEKFVVPKSVQQAIPIQAIWGDGIFQIGKNKFARTYKFVDINYAVASREDKEAMFLEYSELLNSFDSGATTKITINNRRLNRQDFEKAILIPMQEDGLDLYRKEYNAMLLEKVTGANSMVQEKYVTVSVYKKSIEEARTYFARVGADLTGHFMRLASKCVEMDATDRLRALHDFYRTGEETGFYFDLSGTMKKGHSFKDFICPDSLEFEKDPFRMGNRFGRVLFLREYASYIKDSMIAELTDLNRNLMMSIDVIPISTDEAVREVENRLLGVPGSGKSFSAKMLIVFLALATGDDILICDPEREYASLIEAMGGEVIRIAAGSRDHINAMDMVEGYGDGGNPVIDKSEFVLSLFEQLDKKGVSAKEKSIIDRCTAAVYEDYQRGGAVPTLCVLREKMLEQPEREAKDLALALELFTSGSLYAFAHENNVDVNNRMVVYDIMDLGKQLKTMGLLVITDAMLNRVTENWKKGKRTHIFLDEFHVVFENEYSGAFFNSAWRRFRKRNAFPNAITQNVEYLLDSVLASTMLSNSEYIVMLNQAASDRQKLAELLNISNEQMSYITNADAGCGLMKYGSSLVPFINKFPKNTRLYKLMTTKPGEDSANRNRT